MATLAEINSFLVNTVTKALNDAGVENVQVGSEWPPEDALQDAGKNDTSVIAIVHRTTAYTSKENPYGHSIVQQSCNVKSVVSDPSLAPGHTSTITLSLVQNVAALNMGDAISCQLSNGDADTAAVAVATNTDTITTLAAELATQINQTFTGTGISAAASGAVVSVTNNGANGYEIQSNYANTAILNKAAGNACRSMQITSWTGDLDSKFAIEHAIETLLATYNMNTGFNLDSGEFVKVKFMGATPGDADTDKDLFCDHYIFELEHVVDSPVPMFGIVAAIATGSTY